VALRRITAQSVPITKPGRETVPAPVSPLLHRQPFISPERASYKWWRAATVHDFLLAAGEMGSMAEIKALALLNRHLTQQATVAAYQDCFMLVVVSCMAVAPSFSSYAAAKGQQMAAYRYRHGLKRALFSQSLCWS
jgi:hypothetical protein